MPGTRSFPPGGNFSGFRRFHDRDRRPVPFPFFPFGLFADSLFPDGTGPQESSAPPSAGSSADLMQALSALGKASAPIPPPSEPLLIELQGDRYVRLSIGEARENPANSREPITVVGPAAPAGAQARASAPPELAPVSLVFRDGHSEEVRDYSIIGGVLYARGDYYIDGYWNKTIELASLNLAETVKSNEARGIHFTLPTAANEVVTRP